MNEEAQGCSDQNNDTSKGHNHTINVHEMSASLLVELRKSASYPRTLDLSRRRALMFSTGRIKVPHGLNPQGRIAIAGALRLVRHVSKPALAPEIKVGDEGSDEHQDECHGVTQRPIEFGHNLEIHAVD